jgi:hypothetical protein
MRTTGRGLGWIAGVLLLAAGVRADVAITRRPAVVEHKTFDPAHRPADMPPLSGDEAAVTQSSFECQVAVDYEVVSRNPANGRCTTSIRFHGVRMTLRMKVVVWLPEHAPAKLKAHEEGHRQIDERAYKDADRAARQIAQAMDGQIISGEGATCAAAEKQATNSAAGKLCRLYIERVAKRAARISDIYDQITAHGTRGPAEDEAIRQAFEQEQKDATSTTRPSE